MKKKVKERGTSSLGAFRVIVDFFSLFRGSPHFDKQITAVECLRSEKQLIIIINTKFRFEQMRKINVCTTSTIHNADD